MNYRQLADPQLRLAAVNVPFNKHIIPWANAFQSAALTLTRTPAQVRHSLLRLKGHKGYGFRTDIFEPEGSDGALPALIYAHGGAFCYRAAAYHKKLACAYALKAGCRVFFPDYHLAPKYPYPAAYEDIVELYRYIQAHSAALRIDPEKIGLAGDSAGAALAALVCRRYEREGLKRPCLQMLVYPVTDAAMETESMRRFTDTPLRNAENNRRMWAYYRRGLGGEEQYLPSPMHNALPEIIPDTYIEAAELDCLHDEGLAYGKKLCAAGARVEINDTKGTFHGYDIVLSGEIVGTNIEKRVGFLRNCCFKNNKCRR